MKKAFLPLMAIGLVLGLVGCAQATSPSTDPNAPQNPTISALVGTWTASNSSSNTSGGTTTTNVFSDTLNVAADGSYTLFQTQASTPTGGSTTTSYSAKKGQLSFSANQATTTITDLCYSSSPITTANAVWTPESQTTSSTATTILSGGKLYGYLSWPVFTAQGSTSGLVGTWQEIMSSTAGSTTMYGKMVYAFAADGTLTSQQYSDTTTAFTAAPVYSITATYTAQNGILTTTAPGQAASSGTYKIVGSYLIIGDATSVDAYAYTKQ